tara:strand:+ start:979 stop:1803 length:825 start_codon:yes stop_codon:yes gene_type:complete
MKILLSCVNYNSYKELIDYLLSIEKSFILCNGAIDLTVLVGDNSETCKRDLDTNFVSFELKYIFNNSNLGYIGGVSRALTQSDLTIKDYDIFIISNVDLLLSESFFLNILSLKITEKTGWIAPSILSENEKRDRNPKILKRPTRKKMLITQLIFKVPILHYLYSKTIYCYKSKRIPSNYDSSQIYAGHGSFMIFTSNAILANINFEFPSFLFGEEIYYAELLLEKSLNVIYSPELQVVDIDHVSTSKMKRSDYYEMNYRSLKVITKLFFNYEYN